jgi:hypothetical protein
LATYSEYDVLKVKMRIPDDSLKDELLIYMDEIDDLIDNRLRAKLGEIDSNGNNIVLPLTTSTIPQVDQEIKAIAIDMVEGKFRLKTSEKTLLWDTSVKSLENYLERRFGWTINGSYQINPTLTVSPTSGVVGTTVTISGTQWIPNATLSIKFGGLEVTTSPSTVVSDAFGEFSGVTFTVPNNSLGGFIINVTDYDSNTYTKKDPNLQYNGKNERFRII